MLHVMKTSKFQLEYDNRRLQEINSILRRDLDYLIEALRVMGRDRRKALRKKLVDATGKNPAPSLIKALLNKGAIRAIGELVYADTKPLGKPIMSTSDLLCYRHLIKRTDAGGSPRWVLRKSFRV